MNPAVEEVLEDWDIDPDEATEADIKAAVRWLQENKPGWLRR